MEIAVKDGEDQNPFSIALLRGYKDIALAILEIANAQYEPESKSSERQARYRIAEEDKDSDDGESSNKILVLESVKDDLKIENIAGVTTQVKSHVSPLTLLSWDCSISNFTRLRHHHAGTSSPKITWGLDKRESKLKQFEYTSLLLWAIESNDIELFNFMLNLDAEWTARLAKDNISETHRFSTVVTESNFTKAIGMGRVSMVGEIIRRCGAGIDLEELVKKSGVKFVEKPKYYQGLSVCASHLHIRGWSNQPCRFTVRNDRIGSLLLEVKINSVGLSRALPCYWPPGTAVLRAWSGFSAMHLCVATRNSQRRTKITSSSTIWRYQAAASKTCCLSG